MSHGDETTMQTDMSHAALPGELTQVVESVFAAMMQLGADPCTTPWFPGANRLTAAVRLTGEWNGAVLIECDQRQACAFAGRFLSIDCPKSADDLVRDVLGELANMIGGNLKCVLTHGMQLSMPLVLDEDGASVRIAADASRRRLAFQCAEGTFWVTILATPKECAPLHTEILANRL